MSRSEASRRMIYRRCKRCTAFDVKNAGMPFIPLSFTQYRATRRVVIGGNGVFRAKGVLVVWVDQVGSKDVEQRMAFMRLPRCMTCFAIEDTWYENRHGAHQRGRIFCTAPSKLTSMIGPYFSYWFNKFTRTTPWFGSPAIRLAWSIRASL